MKTKNKDNLCVICGDYLEIEEIAGITNDASPVKEGVCCSYCNLHEVAPKRYSLTRPGNDVHGEQEYQVMLHNKRDFIDRIDYLKSLPKDKDGNPIVDEESMRNITPDMWEADFFRDVIGIDPFDYDEWTQLKS